MVELRRNVAKHKLADGGIVSVALGPMSADLIEHFGLLGFDAIWLEGEHGPVDYGDIADLTRACDLWGKSSLMRVNQHDPGVIYRTLDVGAQGIAIPHVNTAEEALAVVDAAKFGPIGHRGSATGRQGIGVADYFAKANDETMIVVLGAGAAASLSLNPFEAMTTVTAKIVSQLTGDGEFNSPETLVAFALGMTLFVITLALNVLALWIVRRYREQYE